MRFYLGHPNYDELIISIPCQNRPKIHLRNGAKSPRIHEEESRITTIFNWKRIELFQKKSKQGRLRIHFSENTSWNFQLCHLPFRNSGENKLSPLEILKNCMTPLGKSKVKNQDPFKFHMSFSLTPLETPLIF